MVNKVFETLTSSLLNPGTASFDAVDGCGGMMCGGWGFMGFGALLWILLLILIIVVAVILVNRATAPPPTTVSTPSTTELREEIRRLRQEIRELKEKRDGSETIE